MKNTKILSLMLAGALAAGALAGCSQSQPASDSSTQQEPSSSQVESAQASGLEAEAEQLLSDLTGSYQELFPVLFEGQYDQLWIDDSAAIVGEADAPSTAEMLKESVSGSIWGEEAIEAYGEEGGPFYCGWLKGLAELTIDGDEMKISGADATGKELFSGTYHYDGMAGDLYVFKSDDASAEGFMYFAFLPDTPDSTHHIEFRYGPDNADFGEWMAGEYAYWMAAGIPVDHTRSLVEDCIKLFCDENLAE